MKNYIAGFAVLGLIGCFLPLVSGASVSLFDLHHLTWRAWLIVGAFAAPAIAAWRASAAAATLVGLASFGYLGLRLGPQSIARPTSGGPRSNAKRCGGRSTWCSRPASAAS